ncbi:diphosphomevalonate decarboxylase [Candidatus Micrarchaeota archaeon]|nr:diphosphomevalonate decarboxylase [Candidatus Micrarchaeota archaeon]
MPFYATAEANPNLAIIKYWGKRLEPPIIAPMNNSVSVTLDEQLRTRTTVLFSPKFERDKVWINGSEMRTPEELEKALPQLDAARKLAGSKLYARVVSATLTPLAGGLAGSAAGLCALAAACNEALELDLSPKDLSILCRIGSGSSCRSVYGGFAEWLAGTRADGSDSYAAQWFGEDHWKDFRTIVAIVSHEKKKVKSRAGMKQTVQTSMLYQQRLRDLPARITALKNALQERDIARMAEIAMRDSNSLHAVCLDTWPPILYLNDTSKEVIDSIHEFNADDIKAGYSFDAGPNPTIFTVEKHVPEIQKRLKEIPAIEDVIVSSVGSGPRALPDKGALMGADGTIRRWRVDNKKHDIIVEG